MSYHAYLDVHGRGRVRWIAVALLLGIGCSHDWDAYDPRGSVASSGAGAVGPGGAGTGAGGSGATGAGAGAAGGTGAAGGEGGGMVCLPDTVAYCYEGPAGTDGVAACHGGMQTCAADGSGFGPCTAQVLPVAETCATPGDDDCDGFVNEDGAGCMCTPATMIDCYSGPGGTQGIGVCVAGKATCKADGTGYDACVGQVVPSVEDCAIATDEDCNSTANDHCAIWFKQFGKSGTQDALGLTVDAAGAVIVTGRSAGTGNFGGADLPTAGLDDVFVAKLASDGTHIWSAEWGGATDDVGLAVATDAAGDIYVTGSFGDTIDFGTPLTTAGLDDVFVAKLSPAGVPIWSVRFGGTLSDIGTRIAVDAAGDAIVGGTFNGSVTFGADTYTAPDVDTDGFVVKLASATGAVVWSRQVGGVGSDDVMGVAVDATKNIYVTGSFDETVSFGGATLADAGSNDVFVAKLAPDGSEIWSKAYGDSHSQYPVGIGLAPGGELIIAGQFTTGMAFGSQALVGAGLLDVFAARLDANGDPVWSKGFGDAAGQQINGMAVDGTGAVLLALEIDGAPDFGGGPLVTDGPTDAAIAKLDGAGNHLWSRRFGDTPDQDTRAVAAGPANEVYACGQFVGTMDVGTGPVTTGSEDGWLARFVP